MTMTSHIYAIGQSVSFARPPGVGSKLSEVFVVTALLPPLGGGAAGLEFQYRIKSEGESYERVAVEHQLSSVIEAKNASSAAGAEAKRVFAARSPKRVA
jgi:predicted ABC-type sugar transport system permease subunit